MMKDKVKVQEEFENLIDELERLKGINELTSINADYAEKIISNVDTFIEHVEKYREELNEDLKKQAKSNKDVIEELEKAVDNFTKISEEVSQEVDESVAKISSGLQNTFSDRFIELEKSIKQLNQYLDSISAKIVEPKQLEEYQTRIEGVEGNIKSNNKKVATSLAEMITKKNNKVKGLIDNQDQEIKKLKYTGITFFIIILALLGFVIYNLV